MNGPPRAAGGRSTPCSATAMRSGPCSAICLSNFLRFFPLSFARTVSEPPSRTRSSTGSPAGPSGGTRSRGKASAASGTVTFKLGTRIVAVVVTAFPPQPLVVRYSPLRPRPSPGRAPAAPGGSALRWGLGEPDVSRVEHERAVDGLRDVSVGPPGIGVVLGQRLEPPLPMLAGPDHRDRVASPRRVG